MCPAGADPLADGSMGVQPEVEHAYLLAQGAPYRSWTMSGVTGIDPSVLPVLIRVGVVQTSINGTSVVEGGPGVLIDPEPEPLPPAIHAEPEPPPPVVHPEPDPLRPIIDEFPEQGGGVILDPEPPQMPSVTVSDDGGQEKRVRDRLKAVAAWVEPERAPNDDAIAARLGMTRGPRADVVMVSPSRDQWVVAGSKGVDVQHAVKQLTATAQALWAHEPGAVPTNTEVRVYVNAAAFVRAL